MGISSGLTGKSKTGSLMLEDKANVRSHCDQHPKGLDLNTNQNWAPETSDMEWLLLLFPRPLQHRGLRTSWAERPRPWPGEVHPELRELNVSRLLLFFHVMWWGWWARAEAMPVTADCPPSSLPTQDAQGTLRDPGWLPAGWMQNYHCALTPALRKNLGEGQGWRH